MKRDLALKCLKKFVNSEDIVVAVYQTLFDWMAMNPRDLNYVSTGAMGHASSHGLGLALANPNRRILILDGDGSLLMNLGALATIVDACPENLYHFVIVNGVYEVNGCHPIPAQDKVDFAAVALACGYQVSASFESLVDLEESIGNLLVQTGPVFVELKVEPGRTFPRNYGYIHSAEARQKFRAALNAGRTPGNLQN